MIYKSADGTPLILSGRTSQGVFYAVTIAINRLFWKDKKLVKERLLGKVRTRQSTEYKEELRIRLEGGEKQVGR